MKNQTQFSMTQEELSSFSTFVDGLKFDDVLKATRRQNDKESDTMERASVCLAFLKRLNYSLSQNPTTR